MRLAAIVAVLCAIGAGAPSALAQQSVDVGSVSGRVTDQSGAVVTDAQVTARQTQTNLTTTTTTDQDGRFRLPYLRVGPYEITVRQSGFEDAVRDLTVGVGGAFELPVTLSVSGIATNVTVTADATVLEAARSQIAATVSEAEVRSLPMNGRNFLELALLVPGVSPTNVASTQLFPETSAVPGITLSVASQRNLSNNFIVDGLSANDDAAALSGITYGVDAIEQFQVVTSGAQAELGRALGGYVNVVTKSGTNLLHGTAYDYVRDDRFNAENPLLRAKLPMNQTSVRRQRRRTGRAEPHVLFRQRRAAPARSDGTHDHQRCQRQRHQRTARCSRLWRPARRNRGVPQSGGHHERASARSTIRSAAAISSAFATASMTSPRELTRRRRSQRTKRVVEAGQPRSNDRG